MKRLTRILRSSWSTAILAAGLLGSAKAQTADAPTTTPIKHLVVIFQENVSFDHYFATYPTATNPASEPSFTIEFATGERGL